MASESQWIRYTDGFRAGGYVEKFKESQYDPHNWIVSNGKHVFKCNELGAKWLLKILKGLESDSDHIKLCAKSAERLRALADQFDSASTLGLTRRKVKSKP